MRNFVRTLTTRSLSIWLVEPRAASRSTKTSKKIQPAQTVEVPGPEVGGLSHWHRLSYFISSSSSLYKRSVSNFQIGKNGRGYASGAHVAMSM